MEASVMIKLRIQNYTILYFWKLKIKKKYIKKKMTSDLFKIVNFVLSRLIYIGIVLKVETLLKEIEVGDKIY